MVCPHVSKDPKEPGSREGKKRPPAKALFLMVMRVSAKGACSTGISLSRGVGVGGQKG